MKYAQRKTGAEYEAWYPNGKQAARYTTSPDRLILNVEAWDEDGNQTRNLDEILNQIDTELDPRRER
jgi:antitoxin component YwqK of YwqJK toxin-antitoxin module